MTIVMGLFWGSHGIIIVDYLEKRKTINGKCYASVLQQLSSDKITGKQPILKIHKLRFKLMPPSSISPDLVAPSDYWERFSSNSKIITTRISYLKTYIHRPTRKALLLFSMAGINVLSQQNKNKFFFKKYALSIFRPITNIIYLYPYFNFKLQFHFLFFLKILTVCFSVLTSFLFSSHNFFLLNISNLNCAFQFLFISVFF